MAAVLPFFSNSLHCNRIRYRTCTYSTNSKATFQLPRTLTIQLSCCRKRVVSVEFRKSRRLALNFHDHTLRSRNCGKLCQSGFPLSASSPWEHSKRHVIGFSEPEHIESVEVVDGNDGKRHFLGSCTNSFRNSITMDHKAASLGAKDKFLYLPLSDDRKQYSNEVSELEGQLCELFNVVEQMIKTGDEGTARELIEANYEVVTEQLEMGVKGVEQAAMLVILAQLNMSLCEFTFAEYLLEQIKEIMANVGNHEPLVDRILEIAGSMYIAFEKPEEALPLCTRSLEIQECIHGKNSPLLVTILLCLADTLNLLGEESTSIELYHRAISILEAKKGAEREDLVFALTQMSQVLIAEYRIEEAEDSLRRALALMEKQHGENDVTAGSITCVLAHALSAKGDVKDAVTLYRKGLSIMENSGNISLDDTVLKTIRIDLAELLHVLGREEESQQLWEQNLLIKEEALGSDHPSLAMHIQNLATSYAYSGNFEKSELLLRRSLRILSARLVHDAPETSVPMLSLATILHHQGRTKEAEDLALDALRIREAFFDKDSPVVGEACDCLALIQHALGKDDRAESLMWRVLHIHEKEFGYDSPEVMSTLEFLIVLVDNLGKKNHRVLLQRRLAKLKMRYRK